MMTYEFDDVTGTMRSVSDGSGEWVCRESAEIEVNQHIQENESLSELLRTKQAEIDKLKSSLKLDLNRAVRDALGNY